MKKSAPCLLRHVSLSTALHSDVFFHWNGVGYRLPISDFSRTLTHFIAFEEYMANFGGKSWNYERNFVVSGNISTLRKFVWSYIIRTTTTLRNRRRLGQGFRFRRGKRSLSSAASQTDDVFFFTKNFVLLQSCYGIQRPPQFASHKLWRWLNRRRRINCSLRPALFDFGGFLFVAQLLFSFWSWSESRSRTALDLQLL